MGTAKIHKSILKIVDAYKVHLATQSEEEFQLLPPIGGWSYSEVYAHIFDSSLLSLMAIQNCISGTGKTEATTLGAKAVLFFGMLPPGKRYKVPPKLMERVKKINRMTAQQFITDFELQLTKISPHLSKANPALKIKHPRLGYLNAKQWLRFIEIHLNHHLKQLRRIQNSFELAG
ncbi:DinB family protein [Pedobacter insulae]|uniref:DinB superfamily protein n=1 Tax=Pedobacter insulae TaxID=414048 RepID=A0A1I2TCC1_9SPHI|nr:DinB family protein [Pedobacter insulae]SFG60236.1 DinB superfamily protein [Pedobacter insulae]